MRSSRPCICINVFLLIPNERTRSDCALSSAKMVKDVLVQVVMLHRDVLAAGLLLLGLGFVHRGHLRGAITHEPGVFRVSARYLPFSR